MPPQCLPPSLGSIRLKIWEKMWSSWILEWIILAILNSKSPLMPPKSPWCLHQVSAQSDLRFRRCRLNNFKMPPWQPSWLSEWTDFSNSKSPGCPNASYQVSPESDLWFWMRCWKCEKLTTDQRQMTDRQMTDNRPQHKLTWSQAPGELINT